MSAHGAKQKKKNKRKKRNTGLSPCRTVYIYQTGVTFCSFIDTCSVAPLIHTEQLNPECVLFKVGLTFKRETEREKRRKKRGRR